MRIKIQGRFQNEGVHFFSINLLSEWFYTTKRNMGNTKLAKVSLLNAALVLSDLCDKVDELEELDKALIAEFEDARLTLAESIDRRKHVYRELLSKIELAKARKNELNDVVKKLEFLKEKIENRTKEVIQAKPDLPYQDTLGNKLSIRKNSIPSLKVSLDLRSSKTVNNILDSAAILQLGANSKYIEHVSYFTLNVELLKKDLSNGTVLPWAYLEWGSHLRGLSV